ncbi:MAG: ACT domain-containing protein [Pseudomonadales bacterium]
MEPPKYALPEIERRWLVEPTRARQLQSGPRRLLTDLYLDHGRLRLRTVTEPDGSQRFKLCKKYPATGSDFGAIANLYLSATEHALLEHLPGWRVEKARYTLGIGSIDRYQSDDETLFVYECEFESAQVANGFTAPAFISREITRDADLSGAALARRFGRHSGGDAPTPPSEVQPRSAARQPSALDPPSPSTPGLDSGRRLTMRVRPGSYSVHRFAPGHAPPAQLLALDFVAVLRSPTELSVVCGAQHQLAADASETGWACLEVIGPLPFHLTGILAKITAALATAGIPVFAVSSYDTDYVLVREQRLGAALAALRNARIQIEHEE